MTLQNWKKIFFYLCICNTFAYASLKTDSLTGFYILTGDLPAVIAARDKPYCVVGDVFIPYGKTTIIEGGVILLFKNFATFHVQGILLAEGKKDKPVVFTSINDNSYNKASKLEAAAYDWNGITIHQESIGSQFNFCVIMYSVYGINSFTKFFKIDPGLFSHNGRANVTIEGIQQTVNDYSPYEYVLTKDDPLLQGIPMNLLKDPRAPLRNSIRYVSLAVSTISLTLGVYTGVEYFRSKDKLNQLSQSTPENLAFNTSSDWESAQKSKNRNFLSMIFCFSSGVAGVCGFTYSFTF